MSGGQPVSNVSSSGMNVRGIVPLQVIAFNVLNSTTIANLTERAERLPALTNSSGRATNTDSASANPSSPPRGNLSGIGPCGSRNNRVGIARAETGAYHSHPHPHRIVCDSLCFFRRVLHQGHNLVHMTLLRAGHMLVHSQAFSTERSLSPALPAPGPSHRDRRSQSL